MHAWKSAKEANSFQRFAPFLEKIIEMNRKKARLLGYKEHPYDALLDIYEPGMTTAILNPIFTKLRDFTTDFLKKISGLKQVDSSFLHQCYDKEKQLSFCHHLINAMGYNKEYGRLDLSVHPFSISSHPTDSRITIRIHPQFLYTSLFAALHEGGQSLYEMGLPKEEFGTPLCQFISLGIHESQSRWWETKIGKSLPFWKSFYPALQSSFSDQLSAISLEDFYKAINQIQPTFIRVEADEVTYNLHVILRFELEKALIEGELSTRDIPEAWNEKMKQMLGIYPPSDALGCLQDVHWSMGSFGYFPTYSLGNLYASQFFEAFEKDHPNWQERLSHGELLFIKEWLNHSIHQYGRQYCATELIEKICKQPFTIDPFIRYIQEKYAFIYSM